MRLTTVCHRSPDFLLLVVHAYIHRLATSTLWSIAHSAKSSMCHLGTVGAGDVLASFKLLSFAMYSLENRVEAEALGERDTDSPGEGLSDRAEGEKGRRPRCGEEGGAELEGPSMDPEGVSKRHSGPLCKKEAGLSLD